MVVESGKDSTDTRGDSSKRPTRCALIGRLSPPSPGGCLGWVYLPLPLPRLPGLERERAASRIGLRRTLSSSSSKAVGDRLPERGRI